MGGLAKQHGTREVPAAHRTGEPSFLDCAYGCQAGKAQRTAGH